MKQESPQFNHVTTQQQNSLASPFKVQLQKGSQLIFNGKDHEEFDGKLIGFQSIDQLFAQLQPKQLEQKINKIGALPQSSKIKPPYESFEQMKKSSQLSKLPNITINYANNILQANSNSPTKWIQRRPYKKKIVEYEQKVIRVPVQKQVIDYLEIEHIIPTKQIKKDQPLINSQQQTPVKIFFNSSQRQQKKLEPSRKSPQRPSLRGLTFLSPVKPSDLQQHRVFTRIKSKPITNDLINQYQKIRYVTSDKYNYAIRKNQLQAIDRKLLQLKQMEYNLLSK